MNKDYARSTQDDTISRQAVDKIINDLLENDNLQASPSVWYWLHMIKQLPSAQPEKCEDCVNFNKTMFLIPQPEPKKGRWIDMGDHVMCGCCGATHYGVDKNYCPNCGAKMRGEQE